MDNPTDLLAVEDEGKGLDSDSAIGDTLGHSDIFAADLAGLKRRHDDDDDDDDDSVDSLAQKKLRFEVLSEDLEGSKSPLTNEGSSIHRDESSASFKTESNEPALENMLRRGGSHASSSDYGNNHVLDPQHPSSERMMLGMDPAGVPSSPPPATQDGRRAHVFGIDFTEVQTPWQTQGSPLRDAAAANAEHQPLPLNDQDGQRQGNNGLHHGFNLDGPTGDEKKMGVRDDNHRSGHYQHPGGKTLPGLDPSRASLDDPDDDRLVAADTEDLGIHSPVDFRNSDTQSNQPIPVPMHSQMQPNQSQNLPSPHPNRAIFSQLQQSLMANHAGVPGAAGPFNGGLLFQQFQPPMQQRFLPGGFGVPRPMMRPPAPAAGVSLALSCDDEQLSEYQVLIRNQLEIFEATQEDVESNTQGRKKQVYPGQVGIRCRHCASFPLRQRGRGAVYYPARLQGVYQAAQNMASSHLCESCQYIPQPLKQQLRGLRERRDTAGGGKQYWADGARALGLHETKFGLRLKRRGDP